ncbi:ankyrin repeat-containing protein NPR4 isoform X3 [Medicago truncatula]|uniref:ankyrin repeat-containing protein NPR4 isoform X3 n=1 Tax=Medicago truncatula TaxID=3880 RepID=UPI000D2F1755|nr:ankyrin repeat-containing protein NPR4 isoform X3 [Medicago truncatula]
MAEIELESLFNHAIRGQWREVIESYEKNPKVLEAKITKVEDTLLHIAVYLKQTLFVTTLLDKISKDMCWDILRMQNSKGNTPLHVAAELGNVEICNNIAKRDPILISCRNFEGETPLFLAAVYGKREAFFCLHSRHQDKDDYSVSRKNNGDTILHSTISSEYFGLALQIIGMYPKLVNAVNHDGLSPLHILARKPNCFRSCTRMELIDSIIYTLSGSFVDDDKEERYDHINEAYTQTSRHYPLNYGTCMTFLSLLNSGFKVTKQGQPKREKKHYLFPPNWESMIRLLVLGMKACLIIFGVGATWVEKIQRRKEKHIRAKQVMNELIQHASLFKYDFTGPSSNVEENGGDDIGKIKSNTENEAIAKRRTMSPILIAAKMGVTEMIEKILDVYPVAIQDVDSQNKNVVLLAIENRQPHVYSLLNKRSIIKETAFRQVDINGNSALHLAATYRRFKPWRVPGAAMQMQWEYKWYKLVKDSMPPNFYERYNKDGKTAKQVFIDTHGQLVKEGGKWLTKTAESCSVVAALVASVAFTTSTSIPGGYDDDGIPIFLKKPVFKLYAVASLVALCSSVMALVMFLSILTSRFQEKDFLVDLPKKLLLGLTTLFTSIASVLVSFCAGHFFIVEHQLRTAVYPIYALTCLPVSFFALVQLPLYFDLSSAMFRKVPQRSYKVFFH